MGWDIEFNSLTDTYELVFNHTNDVYELSASEYEAALDEAAVILDSIGFYEEA